MIFQVVSDFEPIALENMPGMMSDEQERELSTDVKYLYQMAKAISNGAVSVDLANIKPGPVVHSRWLTKASRVLRLYTTTNTPSENLKTLAVYIIRIYVPMYFNVKYYNSVVYGSVLLSKFIRWTRYLPRNLLNIVDGVIQNNSYYAHPENILLTMLFDDRKAIRDRAIKKILYYREKILDPTKLRVYKKYNINFNASDYTDMIDLNDNNLLSEPAFTRNIPYDHLVEFLDYDEPTLDDPNIPMHIQGTERYVQLLTSVSKRVIEKKREGVMAVTAESREKQPRMESKKDFKK